MLRSKRMSPGKKSFCPLVVLSLCLLLVLALSAARADVRLPAVFSDNLVLQQGAELPIWGWAEAGEHVNVILAPFSQAVIAKADKDGRWMVKMGPFKAESSCELVIEGKNTVRIKNVAVGEV
jgi:sialate O-acetylesterase